MKKTKITCNITDRTKNEIQYYVDENLYKSQSQFVSNAIDFYLAHLHSQKDIDYLGKIVTQTVDAIVSNHTDRISDMIFKYAVAVEKETLVENYGDDYYEDYLEGVAIDNVKKRIGRL